MTEGYNSMGRMFMGKAATAAFGIFAVLILGIGIGLGAGTSTTVITHENSPLLVLSLISQSPDPVMAGDIAELRIGVENEGGVTADNVVLEIANQYPFELVSSSDSVVSVGTISPYQADSDMRIAKATLKVDPQASAGTYQLKVLVYEEGKKAQMVTERIFSISVGSQANVQITSIDKTELVPGKQTPLKFVVKNVGLSPLKDLTFSWSSNDDIILPVGSDNTRHIDYLGVGQEISLEYNVSADADATAGLYKLSLALSYEDSVTGTERTSSTVAGIYVGGGTDFDVAYSETSGNEVSFSVANVGNNPAYSVSVNIPDQSGWSVSGSRSVIIGNLNKGDYTVATFTLSQTGVLSGNRTRMAVPLANTGSLAVAVEYTDTRGERKVFETNVSMASSNGNSSSFGGSYQNGNYSSRYRNTGGLGGLSNGMSGLVTIAIWGIVALIVIGGAYFLYRRRRAKKAVEDKKATLDRNIEKAAVSKARK